MISLPGRTCLSRTNSSVHSVWNALSHPCSRDSRTCRPSGSVRRADFTKKGPSPSQSCPTKAWIMSWLVVCPKKNEGWMCMVITLDTLNLSAPKWAIWTIWEGQRTKAPPWTSAIVRAGAVGYQGPCPPEPGCLQSRLTTGEKHRLMLL